MLLSYIPLSPHLPSNYYKMAKMGLLVINELWKNSRKKNGRFARIYHKTATRLKWRFSGYCGLQAKKW